MTGNCSGDDDQEVIVEGNISDDTPYGTITFIGSDDSTSTDWSGELRFGRLTADFADDVSGGWASVRYEGEFEVNLIPD